VPAPWVSDVFPELKGSELPAPLDYFRDAPDFACYFGNRWRRLPAALRTVVTGLGFLSAALGFILIAIAIVSYQPFLPAQSDRMVLMGLLCFLPLAVGKLLLILSFSDLRFSNHPGSLLVNPCGSGPDTASLPLSSRDLVLGLLVRGPLRRRHTFPDVMKTRLMVLLVLAAGLGFVLSLAGPRLPFGFATYSCCLIGFGLVCMRWGDEFLLLSRISLLRELMIAGFCRRLNKLTHNRKLVETLGVAFAGVVRMYWTLFIVPWPIVGMLAILIGSLAWIHRPDGPGVYLVEAAVFFVLGLFDVPAFIRARWRRRIPVLLAEIERLYRLLHDLDREEPDGFKNLVVLLGLEKERKKTTWLWRRREKQSPQTTPFPPDGLHQGTSEQTRCANLKTWT